MERGERYIGREESGREIGREEEVRREIRTFGLKHTHARTHYINGLTCQ